MKRTALIILMFVLFAVPLTAFGQNTFQKSFNPSMLTASEIAAQLPRMWMANYYEVEHMMEDYPDFVCETYHADDMDEVICQSVNNRFARQVTVDFTFAGDNAGMTGLKQAVFYCDIYTPDELQDYLEKFWLEDMGPYCHSDAHYYDGMYSLLFRVDNTLMRMDFPRLDLDENGWLTIDYWDENQSEYHAVG